jgi:hypothetical protein
MKSGGKDANHAAQMDAARSRQQGEAQRGLDSMHAGEHFDWDMIKKSDNEITARKESFFSKHGYTIMVSGVVLLVLFIILLFMGVFGGV